MMDGGEKDSAPMLADMDAPTTSRRGPSRRFTARSASMFVSATSGADEGELAAAYDAGDGGAMFHTGPLRRGHPATQLVPMSGPLYGGRYRGTPTPPAPPPERRGESPPAATRTREVSPGRWADEGGGYGARRNGHLLDSGQLGMCNDPYYTTCPGAYHAHAAPPRRHYGGSASQSTFHRILHGDASGWARKYSSFLNSNFPIMNPHAKAVQKWNKFYVISCLVAIFIDPLFFFILSVKEKQKCMVFNWPFAIAIAVVRSVTDFIHLLHMLLQFRLAYVAPESRVVGAGDFIVEPSKIALHYLRGYFAVDLFVVLPLPQVMILLVVPRYLGASAANYAKNLLRATFLLQYIPRILRFLPLLAGQSASGFIFESAWANFVINLLMFVLAGHVVGSCWYLFGLQRVNKCLKDACHESGLGFDCKSIIDCGRGSTNETNGITLTGDESDFTFETNRKIWGQNSRSVACLSKDASDSSTNFSFNYGIYQQAPLITQKQSIVVRYIYSLFWGFQQISTLAGNQVPSDFIWEVLFTMGIIGLGLLLFALLIGNMQNFLLALGRRRLEMQLRRRDVEQWMSHRRLPEDLRRQVRQAERFNWAATRGVNEEELLQNLPEDLQREIRRHLFTFLNKVRIFTLMDEPILDAVCERLRQKLYIGESYIQQKGRPIEKMVFIVRGKMESIEADGNASPLSEGDVCGEELLTWYLEHSSLSKDGGKIRFPGQRLFSNRTVRCITNVEAFALQAADLETVTAHFARFLRNPRVQGAIRYESPYWRALAARRIQVAWRYRKWRLHRTDSPSC